MCSCAAHEEKRAAVRATWASQAPDGTTVRFFVGGGGPPDGDDVIVLLVDDSHTFLPTKVMAFFHHALEHFQFDWLFKCNDDTYVDLTRLAELTRDGLDLIGSEVLVSRGSPSGGAGYFLSRSMVERLVAEADIPQAGDEDVLIGKAAVSLGAVTCATNRLVYNHSRFPRVENAVVSSHRCSPDRMRAIHTIRFSIPVGEIPVCHPQWEDRIQLFEGGTFIRKSTDCAGIYQKSDGSFLLRWFDWGVESFGLADDGTLYLTKMPQQESPWFGNEAVNAVPRKDVVGTENDFPLISCVMPTYGRPDYVNEAIRMFLDQDYPNKELVILNDCVGQNFTCDLPPEAGVRVINHPERFPSLGDKRNACIGLAQGEFIAIWDDDDVYLPWRLSHSFRMMKAHGT
ncbi:MAG: glycosyltransferase family 2 protein, partial [Verrucomicrobiaceae bacterium]